MPKGLCNSCATFQRLLNKVLESYLGVWCLVYLEDKLIFSNDEESHIKHVEIVVQRLRENNLKIKPSKCKFARSKLEYLSHIIEYGTTYHHTGMLY